MKRRQFLATAAGALAAPALMRPGFAQSPEYTLKLHHLLGPKAPAQTKMLEPWAKAVEEGTGGRVKIEIYPAMSLGGAPPQLFRQVRDGVVDIVWTVNGYTPGPLPALGGLRAADDLHQRHRRHEPRDARDVRRVPRARVRGRARPLQPRACRPGDPDGQGPGAHRRRHRRARSCACRGRPATRSSRRSARRR